MNKPKWSHAFESKDDRRKKKRMAVLRAGAWLFNERGFDRTTLDDIAEALNVTKRTLYYYVKSKDEILVQCNLRGVEMMRELVESSQDKSLPALKRIEALLHGYFDFLSDDMGLCVVLSTDVPLAPKEREIVFSERRKIDHAMRNMIRDGIEDGTIRPCDPKLTTAAIFGALNWVPYWNRGPHSVPVEAVAAAHIEFILQGLRAG